MVLGVLIGGGIFLAVLLYFSNDIKSYLNKEDTGFFSQKQSQKRDEKGALGNTIDFVAGEGTYDTFKNDSKSSKLSGQIISYQDGSTVFIPSDTVVNPDGTVSGSPPLLSIPNSTKNQILARRKSNG